jgi:hypothetical protein
LLAGALHALLRTALARKTTSPIEVDRVLGERPEEHEREQLDLRGEAREEAADAGGEEAARREAGARGDARGDGELRGGKEEEAARARDARDARGDARDERGEDAAAGWGG